MNTLPDAKPRRAPSKAVRRRDRRVRYLAARLRTLAPHTQDPLFQPLVHSYCRLGIMITDMFERLRHREMVNDDGSVIGLVAEIRNTAAVQSRLAQALNLTPATLREIAREKQVDVTALMAEVDDE
jgi:hypothetical protein